MTPLALGLRCSDEWLLRPNPAVLDKANVDSKDFQHVTWAAATIEADDRGTMWTDPFGAIADSGK